MTTLHGKDEGEQPAPGYRTPGATYRLQFNGGFKFSQALKILLYLRDLGITDCYASPLFKARPQSTHGYDVCGYGELNPELGGDGDAQAFFAALKEQGLGLLLDMVPNHMSVNQANKWWTDVLARGVHSRYAQFFDIEWRPVHCDLHDQVLLPVLGDHYGKVLERGELELSFSDGAFSIQYFDKEYPIAPHSQRVLLKELCERLGPKAKAQAELTRLLERSSETGEAEPAVDDPGLRERLEKLHRTDADFGQALASTLEAYKGKPEFPRTFDRLDGLLKSQHYRLAYWRMASEELNYRRFFDVTELASIRVELPEVFEASHELLRRLVAEGKVTGVRVDHPDGLRDPACYFEWLQEKIFASQLATPGASSAENGTAQPKLYVVAEKILTGDEQLPEDWEVDGTTGYDFLNLVNGIFVKAESRGMLDQIYGEFTGYGADFELFVYQGKKKVLLKSLFSEVSALSRRLKAITGKTRHGHDFSYRQLEQGLVEVIACFPVYRTYMQERSHEPNPCAQAYIREAVRRARCWNPKLEGAVLDFLERLLLLQWPEDMSPQAQRESREFMLRFQQLTGPAMAKGMEDTAFYNFNRLISLNDVGGDPAQFGVSQEKFHKANQCRLKNWPGSMLTTATHDTKRGEDVRARINVLSELPQEWGKEVNSWRQHNTRHKTVVDGDQAPDSNTEYFLYQTLVGAWPETAGGSELSVPAEFCERVIAAMLKAVKEAKAHTSWTDPNLPFEEALQKFIRNILDSRISGAFLREFLEFQKQVAFFGRYNSLAQTVLKLTCPGVPDIYQGTELWDLSLVDPDNRRPVDYEPRRKLLERIQEHPEEELGQVAAELLRNTSTGAVKLFTIYRISNFRRQHSTVFERGKYVPLQVNGPREEHVCAFMRETEAEKVVVAVPRLLASASQGTDFLPLGKEFWGDTYLEMRGASGKQFRNVFTHERCSVGKQKEVDGMALSQVLNQFPVAVLQAL